MNLPEELYAAEDAAKPIWQTFPFLDPQLPFLRRQTIRLAILRGNERYPLDAFKFTLFPGKTDEEFHHLFFDAMSRGLSTVNDLLIQHLGYEDLVSFSLDFPPAVATFHLHRFIKDAFHLRQQSFTGKKDPLLGPTFQAYNMLRALELGFRVVTIDECPSIHTAMQCAPVVRSTLEQLLDFSSPQPSDKDGLSFSWDTVSGCRVYSTDDSPFRMRVKYLYDSSSCIIQPKYSSILVKMYTNGEFAEDIRDHLGAEFIVADDAERDAFLSFFKRNTQSMGTLERFKDSRKTKVGVFSSASYGVQKFILRVPVTLEGLETSSPYSLYKRVPCEIQVLTAADHLVRTQITDAQHAAYKRRQFLGVFPALFPKKFYAAL